jgi:hypothetical protein
VEANVITYSYKENWMMNAQPFSNPDQWPKYDVKYFVSSDIHGTRDQMILLFLRNSIVIILSTLYFFASC